MNLSIVRLVVLRVTSAPLSTLYIVNVLIAVPQLDFLSAEATDARGRILLQMDPSGIVAIVYLLADLQAQMRRRADIPNSTAML